MGVVICDSPTGPFAVVVVPKCGSTTVRIMLADVAQPGQYTINHARTLIRKGSLWKLNTNYQGECHPRSWVVLRNPWRRLLSRWKEKATAGSDVSWPEYVLHEGDAMSRSQASFFDHQRPTHIVSIENLSHWAPEMERIEGITLGAITRARSQGAYDWKQTYRDHPETRDMVRNLFHPDWLLGLTWDDPLA